MAAGQQDRQVGPQHAGRVDHRDRVRPRHHQVEQRERVAVGRGLQRLDRLDPRRMGQAAGARELDRGEHPAPVGVGPDHPLREQRDRAQHREERAGSRPVKSSTNHATNTGANEMNAYLRFSHTPARSGGESVISRRVAVQPAPLAEKAATAPVPAPPRWRRPIVPIVASANSVISDARR
jgi:hypothetical protein